MGQRKTTWGVGVVSLLTIAAWWYAPWLIAKARGKEWQAGDVYAAVDALFSGLALLAVVYAIFLQMEELRLQREELEQTRGELKGQKEQLEQQVENARQSEFDIRFFQLLNLYSEKLNNCQHAERRGQAFMLTAEGILDSSETQQESVGDQFRKTDRTVRTQLRPMMQLLECIVMLTKDARATDFHRSVFTSSVGLSDRRLFAFYLGERATLEKHLLQSLRNCEMFVGVSLPPDLRSKFECR